MQAETIESRYELSPMQQGMLFHSLYAPQSGLYIQQLCCGLHEELCVPDFVRAWQRVVERQAILRTGFHWDGTGVPFQEVHRRVEIRFQQHDWRALKKNEQQKRLRTYLEDDRKQGFVISEAPLMRFTLIRLADSDYQLIWTSHHALLDGRSRLILLGEVFQFYQAFRANRDLELESPRPYRDFIYWRQNQDLASAETFWRNELKGFTAATPLAGPHISARAFDEEETGERTIRLSQKVTSSLLSFARRHELTFNTLLQGAWAVLLSRYSGEPDVLFGTTRAGRRTALEGAESMVGLFINTVPFRVQAPGGATVLAWLKELRRRQISLREHEHTPLLKIREWAEVPRQLPLFESIAVFENYQLTSALKAQTGDAPEMDFQLWERSNYPLALLGYGGTRIILKIAYQCSRFDDPTIKRMLEQLRTLLLGFIAHGDRPLREVPLLTEEQRQIELHEWNDTQTFFSPRAPVHELFAAQARRNPEAIAVVSEGKQLSYRELNARANRLARRLRSLLVEPEPLVAILCHRSIETVVSILAVLKAGGAYVPLDPNYPEERLHLMLEDSKPQVLLAAGSEPTEPATQLSKHSGATLVYVDNESESSGDEAAEQVNGEAGLQRLAYVIYTSGSTGRPKGVMIEHSGLFNLSQAQICAFDLNAESRVLQFSSWSFDASVSELFTTLLSGARLYLAGSASLLPGAELSRLLHQNAITTATLPPSVLSLLRVEGFPALRTIISAGDACSADVAAACCRAGMRFLNAYGPTEVSVCATVSRCTDPARFTSIGLPIANVQVYLLDDRMEPVPDGVTGELFVGGEGIARGYLNQPALTAERFLPDPFGAVAGARLYRTGDLARRLADGEIEFIGRADQQVKVRGFRVEPGEIEAVLQQHELVREAAVKALDDSMGNKRLVAYVTSRSRAVTANELRSFLNPRMPEYMIPSVFVVLDRLPLLPNGKVDRRSLPAPGQVRPELKAAFVSPRTSTEETVASIWRRVLGIDRVGMEDNFFELGGHSLLAAQVVTRIQEVLKVELPFRILFDTPTVASVAARIEAERQTEPSAPPILRHGAAEAPLSFAQQRLWLLDQIQPLSPAYNLPKFLRLRGPLNPQSLSFALARIVARHESLRITFETYSDGPRQRIHAPPPPFLEFVDLSGLRDPELRAAEMSRQELSRPFDLGRGPLLRATLLRLRPGEHLLLLVMHHIVIDGLSLGVLLRELSSLYAAFSRGEESSLEPVGVQYADYALWQREWLTGEVLERSLTYWRTQLDGAPELIALPTDRHRSSQQSYRGATVPFDIPKAVVERLQQLSRQNDATLFMLLLATFQILLHRYTGQEDVVVGTPVAGRSRPEIEESIGFFVNTLVLRTGLKGRETFRQLLGRVREICFAAYAHQEMPFEKLVEELQPARSLSHAPLFQVMFSLLNLGNQELKLPGVEVTDYQTGAETTKFDLTLTVVDEGTGKLRGTWRYSSDLFEAETVTRMAAHWQRLLQALAESGVEREVWQLPVLSKDERYYLIAGCNATAREYPQNECVHHMFERQARLTPDTTALVSGNECLSYAELNARANRLAQRLRPMLVGAEPLVAILCHRSVETVVSILAVFKAGGAYVPLDPNYPLDRLCRMVEDARPQVLLAGQEPDDSAKQLSQHSGGRTVYSEERNDSLQNDDARELGGETPGGSSQRVAYVIYTSGSTGQPKGVMIEHRQLANYVLGILERIGERAGRNFAMVSTFAADLGHTMLFPTLCSGGTLHLISASESMDAQALADYFARREIDCLKIVPSHLRALLAGTTAGVSVVPRRLLVLGGEASTWDLIDEVEKAGPECRIMNHYGPTETTVGTLTHLVSPNSQQTAERLRPTVAVGLPVPNARAYILDNYLEPVPLGVTGELFVGGDGVARGYLNHSAFTAERFLPDPFSRTAGARVYRTGDLARRLPQGEIEFIGRADRQVKIRGFRIEPGEIEAVLNQHASVREVAVLARPEADGQTRLVAYVVPKREQAAGVSTAELRDHVQKRLPAHMMPSALVLLDALPLTSNGKLDLKALPAPGEAGSHEDRNYVEPSTSTEEIVRRIFSQLLGIERVGIADNFFELGGHSLLATQVISRIRELLRVNLSLRSVFEAPTVAQLSKLVIEHEHSPGKTEIIARLLLRVRRMSSEDAG
jgi:amino acid adenylation domain-containing protein